MMDSSQPIVLSVKLLITYRAWEHVHGPRIRLKKSLRKKLKVKLI